MDVTVWKIQEYLVLEMTSVTVSAKTSGKKMLLVNQYQFVQAESKLDRSH